MNRSITEIELERLLLDNLNLETKKKLANNILSRLKNTEDNLLYARAENAELQSKVDDLRHDLTQCLEYLKGIEQKAYDAWKPVQVFRSDSEVEQDEIRQGVLDDMWEEVGPLLEDLTIYKKANSDE